MAFASSVFRILIDIPPHSRESYATPALWPLSDWTFHGVMWRSAAILIPNFVLVSIAMFVIFRASTARHR